MSRFSRGNKKVKENSILSRSAGNADKLITLINSKYEK